MAEVEGEGEERRGGQARARAERGVGLGGARRGEGREEKRNVEREEWEKRFWKSIFPAHLPCNWSAWENQENDNSRKVIWISPITSWPPSLSQSVILLEKSKEIRIGNRGVSRERKRKRGGRRRGRKRERERERERKRTSRTKYSYFERLIQATNLCDIEFKKVELWWQSLVAHFRSIQCDFFLETTGENICRDEEKKSS